MQARRTNCVAIAAWTRSELITREVLRDRSRGRCAANLPIEVRDISREPRHCGIWQGQGRFTVLASWNRDR
eukprot:4366387-Alexandrium_andersonii.AAC.1